MVGVGTLIGSASSTSSLLIQHVTVSDTSGICNFRGSKKGEMGRGWDLRCLHLPLVLGLLH